VDTLAAAISSGFIVGLGASVYCMTSCVNVILPYNATAGKPSIFSGFGLTHFFSLGDFSPKLAYYHWLFY